MSDGRIAQVEVIIFKIIENKPLFLLLKRQPNRGGFWQPVTGGVEEDEDLREAALREMEEETGIRDHLKVHEDVHYFEFEANGGYGWMKEYVYGVQVQEGVEAIISDEHTDLKWCLLDEAEKLLKYESNREGFRKIANLSAAEHEVSE